MSEGKTVNKASIFEGGGPLAVEGVLKPLTNFFARYNLARCKTARHSLSRYAPAPSRKEPLEGVLPTTVDFIVLRWKELFIPMIYIPTENEAGMRLDFLASLPEGGGPHRGGRSSLQMIYTPNENEAGMRLDSYLASVTGESRNAVVRAIDEGRVKIAGKIPDKKLAVSVGLEIEYTEKEAEEYEAKPENIPLDIVYEDSDIIVINNP